MKIAVLRFEDGQLALSLADACNNAGDKRRPILKSEVEYHNV